jgi:hypothetical protein
MQLQSINLLGAALIVSVASCTGSAPPVEKLIGTYRGRFPAGTETLVLHEDGTYDEVFVLPDMREIKNRGSWTQDSAVRPTRIRLASGIVRPDSATIVKLDWELVRGVGARGVELRADPDPDGAIVLELQKGS